jgi:DNA polymerase III epsilon subunit-like protein
MNELYYPKSYIAWDLETSGLDFENDRILEIGAAIVRNGEITERKSWILNNGIQVPEEITQLTGITQELIEKEGRDPKLCLDEFLALLNGAGGHLTHNGMRFDIPFLIAQARHYNAGQLSEEEYELFHTHLRATAIDTAVLVKASKLGEKRMWNESFREFADRVMEIRAYGVKYNVGICCEEMGIDRSAITQHRALGDVELTHEIFKKIV